jgi:FAD:protein FMN transferase
MKQDTGFRQFDHHFRAMGTDVGLWAWNDNEQRVQSAFLDIERYFARIETALSRFRPNSELSRLNRSAGRPFSASPLLFSLVESSLAWRSQTGGIFDPAILNSLVAHGYDRPFAAIEGQREPRSGVLEANDSQDALGADTTNIRLGPDWKITLPLGVGLDLGGIAKGWTVQQATHRLGSLGPCLVDAGGDIACAGTPPSEPWVVTVANPEHLDQDIAVISLENEAVATSSRVYRRWQHQGKPAHHLIDPRTGAPADTNILSVTVIAPRLPDAEIHAKVALILGEGEGLAYLNSIQDLSAIFVTDDGRQLMSGEFEDKAYVSTNRFADRFPTAAQFVGGGR